MPLSSLDLSIIAAFLVAVLYVGLKDRKRLTLDDYWVNARATRTFPLTATMSSSFVGASAIFAIAALSFEGGLIGLYVGLSFVAYYFPFAYWFAPRIQALGLRYGLYTMPQALGLRYGYSVKALSALVSLIVFGLFLGAQFLAIGGFVSLFTDVSLSVATLMGGLVVIAYVSAGGLRADIRTDMFQFIVMLVLIAVFVPLLIMKGGGIDALTNLSVPFLSGTAFMPPAVLIAAFLLIGPTIFSSLDVWQRAYAAKDAHTARRGMMWAGIFTFPFFVMATLMGIYGHILFPELAGNQIVFQELIHVLPMGLLGVSLAGFLAAVMSSADTYLLVVSQTLVNDFRRTPVEPVRALRMSRWVSLIVGLASLGGAVVLLNLAQVAISAVSLQIVLLPAVVGLFFWKRATAKAALASIIIGTIATFMLLPMLGEQAFLPGFFASAIAFVAVSLFTTHAPEEKLNLFELHEV